MRSSPFKSVESELECRAVARLNVDEDPLKLPEDRFAGTERISEFGVVGEKDGVDVQADRCLSGTGFRHREHKGCQSPTTPTSLAQVDPQS